MSSAEKSPHAERVLGGPERPVRVAIVGSGPSGFYTAQHLLAQSDVVVEVDMFDRLATPFGLIRYGVAPDHQKVKSVAKAYARTATDPRFRFFGNVEIGRDLQVAELHDHYHQIVYATGAQTDRSLGIAGEEARGSHAATEFVAWYNGHPDFRDRNFDLSCERAVVIGVGNVAVDVARILSRTPDELVRTDIADHALEVLSRSGVREVVMLGRRGPAQAAFSNTEIKELGQLEDAQVILRPEELELDPLSRSELEEHGTKADRQRLEILEGYARTQEGRDGAAAPSKSRRLVIRFLVSPVEILENEAGAVRGVRLVRNELYQDDRGKLRARATDRTEEVEAGLVFRSVGYRGVPVPGVPFRTDWGTIPHESGRVIDLDHGGGTVVGSYVAGWIKRGPQGVIGTNKPDALETVRSMIDDVRQGRHVHPAVPESDAVPRLLEARGVRSFSFDDWQRLDSIEVERGVRSNRPRVKFIELDEMWAALGTAESPRDRKSRS